MQNLVVLHQMLQDFFPEASKKNCLQGVGRVSDAYWCNVLNEGKRSPNNLLCCPHHSPYILSFGGTAAFTPHREAAGQNVLYCPSLEWMGWGKCALLFLCRKSLLDQWQGVHRPGVVVWNLMLLTTSSCAVDVDVWLSWFFLNSKMISLVFSTFRIRLCLINCTISSLQTWSLSSLMRPTTIVSSANFTVWLVADLGMQLCVIRVMSREQNYSPEGSLMLRSVVCQWGRLAVSCIGGCWSLWIPVCLGIPDAVEWRY